MASCNGGRQRRNLNGLLLSREPFFLVPDTRSGKRVRSFNTINIFPLWTTAMKTSIRHQHERFSIYPRSPLQQRADARPTEGPDSLVSSPAGWRIPGQTMPADDWLSPSRAQKSDRVARVDGRSSPC